MRKIHVGSLIALILIAIVVMAIKANHKVTRDLHAASPSNVFDSYMLLMPGFLQRHAPYVDDAFPLPPFALTLVAPFSELSRPDAVSLWILCKPLFFVPIFLLVRSIVRRAGVSLSPSALLLICIAWANPLLGDIQEGQMNLLMLLPLTVALWCAQNDDRRSQIFAGLALAMAICIKVTPLAFVPYFLLRKRWSMVAWTGAGIVLWLFLVPALCFGWSQNIAWLDQWSHIMILPYVLHSALKYPNGESIPELITRYLSHAPAWMETAPPGEKIPHYVNILDLPAGLVRLLSRGILALIAVAGLWWMRSPLQDFRTRRYVKEIACVAAFMLWASERTWVHHYVTLIFALMAAGMIASDPDSSQRTRRNAWGALVLAALLIPWTSDLGRVFGHDGRRYVESLDFVLIASVALIAAIVTASGVSRFGKPITQPRLLADMPRSAPVPAPAPAR
jgi:alpha-1,2-mannosyltransferase